MLGLFCQAQNEAQQIVKREIACLLFDSKITFSQPIAKDQRPSNMAYNFAKRT